MTDQFQNRKGKWWKQRPTRYLKHTYYTTANSIPQTHVLHDRQLDTSNTRITRQLDTSNTRITRPPTRYLKHTYYTTAKSPVFNYKYNCPTPRQACP
jgi:hypothetical protein